MLGGVKMRLIRSDKDWRLRGDSLRMAIEADKAKGLIPFFVVVTLGTTNSCAFDDLDEIGSLCEESDVWVHVDAAYAGWAEDSKFVC